MAEKTRLTPRQAKAVEALLSSSTNEDAAKTAGVAPRTLYRWLEDPAFRSALVQAEGQVIDGAARRLVLLVDKALDALESVIDTPHQKGAGNKRLASQAVIDLALRWTELRMFEARLAELEDRLNGNKS